MLSYLPDVADASGTAESPVTGTPAETVVMRAAGLRVYGRTVAAGDALPTAGELAVFCLAGGDGPGGRPPRRDGAGGCVAAGFRAAGRAGAPPRRRRDRGDHGRGSGTGLAATVR